METHSDNRIAFGLHKNRLFDEASTTADLFSVYPVAFFHFCQTVVLDLQLVGTGARRLT